MTPRPKPTSRSRCGAVFLGVVLWAALPGCEAVNGFYFGLEEDVDVLVAGLDAAGDRFLPHGPRPPREARRADRSHVQFEPGPGEYGPPRTRPRKPGRHFRDLGPVEPWEPEAAPAGPRGANNEGPGRLPDVAPPPVAQPGEVAWPARPGYDPPRHHQLVVDDARPAVRPTSSR